MTTRQPRYQQTLAQIDAIVRLLALEGRPLSRAELAARMGGGLSTSTLCRWIEIACKEGLVVREGGARATVYRTADACRAKVVAEQMARPLSRRSRVGYVYEFLQDYVPNKSCYLGAARLETLHKKCPIGSSPTSRMEERQLTAFMADLAYSSSKLEGNTYSYQSMLKLIDEGVEASGHEPMEAVMLLNHYEAAAFLARSISYPPCEGDPSVTVFEICSLHAILSHNLLSDPRRCGQLRMTPVGIGESAYIPLAGGADLAHCFEIALKKAAAIHDPFEQAFFLMVHLPYLQPFDDVNKRTARVACSIPLIRAGVLPMSWHDTNAEEFISAVLAVYEYNDTYALAEVFSHGYQRSVERFVLAHRPNQASPIAALYRKQIREAIGAVVAGGGLRLPESVRPTDAGEFLAHVNTHVEALRENSALAVAYGLSPSEVHAWSERSRPSIAER